MTFTRFGWGVSRYYRANFPILGFSSLSNDYAKMVQINYFLTKILQPAIKTFKSELILSHFLIKINKHFNIEMFCLIKESTKQKKKIKKVKLNTLKSYLLKKSKFIYRNNTNKFRFRFKLKTITDQVLISRLKLFLNIFENKLKCLLYFRLLKFDKPTASLYLNYVFLKIAERREPTPKTIIKAVKREFFKLKIKGVMIKFKGRFTRKQRAGKLKFIIGKMPISSIKTRIDFSQQTFILKFGSSNIKFAVAYAR
jgi:hypothetical protein